MPFLEYPTGCDTDRKKIQYALRMQEVLRRIHNAFGKWYKTGVTQNQYDYYVPRLARWLKTTSYLSQTEAQLIAAIEAKYPYVSQLSQAKWEQFLAEDFKPRNNILSAIIPELRGSLKNNEEWSEEVNEI